MFIIVKRSQAWRDCRRGQITEKTITILMSEVDKDYNYCKYKLCHLKD